MGRTVLLRTELIVESVLCPVGDKPARKEL